MKQPPYPGQHHVRAFMYENFMSQPIGRQKHLAKNGTRDTFSVTAKIYDL
jgi:hypothetical protein